MKLFLILLLLTCLAVVEANKGRIKKCGTSIKALCAESKSQKCGKAPFCGGRGLKLRNNADRCCCALKSKKNEGGRNGSRDHYQSRSNEKSCSNENNIEEKETKGLEIDLGVAAGIGKLIGAQVGAGVGLGKQGIQIGVGTGINVPKNVNNKNGDLIGNIVGLRL